MYSHDRIPRFENKTEDFSPEVMRSLTRKAGEVNASHSLNMEQFIDAFGIDKVKKDYAEVANRLQEHTEKKMSQSEKLGHIFEAAYLDSASRHNWFGELSEVTKASKYDDILNGIDMITTIVDQKNTARHFEVSSDLTISRDEAANKLSRIIEDVRAGELATINYFHSDLIGYTGRLKDIPRTVVSLDRTNLNQFLTNWLREPELEQQQMGLLMTSQISAQCEAIARMAKNEHGSDSRAYRRYRSTYETAQEILESNTEFQIPRDRSANAIAEMSDDMAR